MKRRAIRSRKKRQGLLIDLVPAEEAILHVRWLTHRGMGTRQMGKVSGLPPYFFRALRAGEMRRIAEWRFNIVMSLNTTQLCKGKCHPYSQHTTFERYVE
jgi:hypothetical protein